MNLRTAGSSAVLTTWTVCGLTRRLPILRMDFIRFGISRYRLQHVNMNSNDSQCGPMNPYVHLGHKFKSAPRPRWYVVSYLSICRRDRRHTYTRCSLSSHHGRIELKGSTHFGQERTTFISANNSILVMHFAFGEAVI